MPTAKLKDIRRGELIEELPFANILNLFHINSLEILQAHRPRPDSKNFTLFTKINTQANKQVNCFISEPIQCILKEQCEIHFDHEDIM